MKYLAALFLLIVCVGCNTNRTGYECYSCDREVAKDAKACPHCGQGFDRYGTRKVGALHELDEGYAEWYRKQLGPDPVKWDDLIEKDDGLMYYSQSKIPYTGTRVKYWWNGNKEKEFIYKEGRESFYIYYHTNGAKKENGSDNPIPNAKFHRWSDDGSILWETLYNEHGRRHRWTYYHPNGNRKRLQLYRWDGEIERITNYDEDGKRHGKLTIFLYEGGKKQSIWEHGRKLSEVVIEDD